MLRIGISSCPNDIFIFYGILNKKITLAEADFKFFIEDVETLNNLCLSKELEISKISVHAFYYLQRDYSLLNSGAAISEFGPVVVTKKLEKIHKSTHLKIALPGKLTTASALMWFYWKKFFLHKSYSLRFVKFNEIFELIKKDEVDLGVLIHEGRFIYNSLGLDLLVDLGEFWKKETGTLIPLGCIVAQKNLGSKEILERLIRDSIYYAKNNTEEVLSFIKNYAQELDEKVIMAHIKTYVNNFSIDLGKIGRESINVFMNKLKEEGIWNWTHL